MTKIRISQSELCQYFIDRYPQENGYVFYWYALRNIRDRLVSRYFTLDLVNDCIKRDPFVLKYILCIDNRCGKSKFNHRKEGDFTFCDHPMNHQWFEEQIAKQRKIGRENSPKPKIVGEVVYPSIDHMKHAISEAFNIPGDLLCEDKMKIWYRYMKTGKVRLGDIKNYCGRYGCIPRPCLIADPFRVEYCFYARNNAEKYDFIRMIHEIRKYYNKWQWDEELIIGLKDVVMQTRAIDERTDHKAQ